MKLVHQVIRFLILSTLLPGNASAQLVPPLQDGPSSCLPTPKSIGKRGDPGTAE